MKNLIVTLLFSLSGVVVFAAGNVTTENSSSLGYFTVIGFFVLLLAIVLVPFNKENIKSILN